MGKLSRNLETWIDGQTLAAIAAIMDIVVVLVVVFFLVAFGMKFAHAEIQETCYECGRKFVPTADTPLKTRSWPMAFCSDGCKVDYRMGRV